jgi:hypothetical protein
LKLKQVYHVTTFVPPECLERLVAGLLKTLPLKYGRYDQALWWSTPGFEHTRVQEAGQDVAERSPSIKVGFSIPRDDNLLQKAITEGIVANHPWGEPIIYITESLSTRNKADEDGPI